MATAFAGESIDIIPIDFEAPDVDGEFEYEIGEKRDGKKYLKGRALYMKWNDKTKTAKYSHGAWKLLAYNDVALQFWLPISC